MHNFVVAVWFIFHGTHGGVKFPIVAPNAERAAHLGFEAARALSCLYNGHVTRCVGPTSVGVKVTEAK
jgi:hypothetical protein